MRKGRIVFGLILDLLILGGVGFAISNMLLGYAFITNPAEQVLPLMQVVCYFTNLSNAFMALVAFIHIFVAIAALNGKKIARIFPVLRLMATVATTITLIIAVGYLAPTAWRWDWVYDPAHYLFLHTVVPVLSIISFIVWKSPRLKWPVAFLGLLPVLVYGGVMVPLNYFKLLPPGLVLYDFMTIDPSNWIVSAAWGGGMVLGSFLIALILVLIRDLESKNDPVVEEAKEEPALIEEAKEGAPEVAPEAEPAKEEPAKEEPAKEAPVAEPAPAAEPAPVPSKTVPARPSYESPRTVTASPGATTPTRVYHITKQTDSGMWQVKLAKGAKAIKLFDTQAEAIAFTKGLVESRGGSYRIHSIKGKIRK